MTEDNISEKFEFDKLIIALRYTDHGFLCFTTLTAGSQRAVADRIAESLEDGRPSVFFNCAMEKPFRGFSFVNRLIQKNPTCEVYVLYNFQQLALPKTDFDFFQAFNFSRDPWANLKKLFVLGMTEDFEKQIMGNAPDFYSFFLTTFRFDLRPPKNYGIQTEMRYREPANPTGLMGELARSHFESLSQKATLLLSEDDGDHQPHKTQQLFLDVLEAWDQAPDSSPAQPPEVLYSVLAMLKEREPQWVPSLSTAYHLEIMARACNRMKQYADAVRYWEKALRIVVSVQGDEYPVAATLRSAIADSYYEQGEYRLAWEWSEKALSSQKRKDDDPELAKTYARLGLIAIRERDFTAAEQWYQKIFGHFPKTGRRIRRRTHLPSNRGDRGGAMGA